MSFLPTIISWFFPPLCVHCQREGTWLCSAAQDDLAAEPVYRQPIVIPGMTAVCIRGSYDCRPLQQLIHRLKYSYWTGAAEVLRSVIEPLLTDLERLPPDTVIVPIPLHGRRLRERGFNQSRLISRALAEMIHRPVVDLLKRNRYTTPQAGLPAARRLRNVVGAFASERARLSLAATSWPTSVILVDDVITTGSTMAECATVLRQHGVKQITAVALAKG